MIMIIIIMMTMIIIVMKTTKWPAGGRRGEECAQADDENAN